MKTLLLVFSVLLSACSQTISPTNLHDLGLADSNAQLTASTITVTAPEWLRDNRIHYRLLYQNPTQVRYYNLDKWLAPPPALLQQRLTAAGINTPYPVTIEILEFEQQVTSPNTARAVMRFNAHAYDNNQSQVLANKQFALQLNTTSANADGAVTAFAELSKQAVQQLNSWLEKLNK